MFATVYRNTTMAHHHHSIGVRKNLLRHHADDDISQNLVTWFWRRKDLQRRGLVFWVWSIKTLTFFGCLMWFKVSWLWYLPWRYLDRQTRHIFWVGNSFIQFHGRYGFCMGKVFFVLGYQTWGSCKNWWISWLGRWLSILVSMQMLVFTTMARSWWLYVEIYFFEHPKTNLAMEIHHI